MDCNGYTSLAFSKPYCVVIGYGRDLAVWDNPFFGVRMTKSNVKMFSIGTALLLACGAYAQVTVDAGIQKQLIRGYGGINIPEWQGYDMSDADVSKAYGNGPGQMGLSILRIFVNDVQNSWSQAIPTAKKAQALGATVFASPWAPPAAIRITGGGGKYSIANSNFTAYAKHLNDYAKYVKGQGVNLYAVSIANEPDYASDWTYWSTEQVRLFAADYGHLITETKLMSAESFQFKKDIYNAILNDSKALANIGVFGTHLYGTQVSAYPYALLASKGGGKEMWATEHYTESANDANLWPMALDVGSTIHNAMVEGQFNAYVWWFVKRDYSPMKKDGTISKRGYMFAQYAKYVRPGYHRVEATKQPQTNLFVSAYSGKDSLVVVVVNKNTSTKTSSFTIKGFKAGSYSKVTSSGTKNLSADGTGTVANDAFQATFDAQSVTTLVFKSTVPGSSAAVSSSVAPISSSVPLLSSSVAISSSAAAVSSSGTVSLLPSNSGLKFRSGKYQVYTLSGAVLGEVSLQSEKDIQTQIRLLTQKPGTYILKSGKNDQTYRINLEN